MSEKRAATRRAIQREIQEFEEEQEELLQEILAWDEHLFDDEDGLWPEAYEEDYR